ncbi:MAG: dTDP-4-dehydrorhamnose 3,5-epimerase [Owenweeksia sp.]|nr:dTDP-4-dehydrorhamnose 3,5-epimerase [Owenweeksia sp.]
MIGATFLNPDNKADFAEIGITDDFVQDNQSKSARGVLRGLHFQNPPFAQGKLVRVIQGSVLDVAVDIRVGSPTYGKHHKIELKWEQQAHVLGARRFCTRLPDH